MSGAGVERHTVHIALQLQAMPKLVCGFLHAPQQHQRSNLLPVLVCLATLSEAGQDKLNVCVWFATSSETVNCTHAQANSTQNQYF